MKIGNIVYQAGDGVVRTNTKEIEVTEDNITIIKELLNECYFLTEEEADEVTQQRNDEYDNWLSSKKFKENTSVITK